MKNLYVLLRDSICLIIIPEPFISKSSEKMLTSASFSLIFNYLTKCLDILKSQSKFLSQFYC